MIELPAAVIGDVDPLHPMLHRDPGIFRRRNALDRERDVEALLDPLHRGPVERGLERAALHPPPSGGDEALGDVAFAPAVVRDVNGEAEAGIAVGNRALDVIVHPPRITAHVELIEPQRIGCRCREVLEAGVADRAEHMRHPELLDPAHHGFGPKRMEALQ